MNISLIKQALETILENRCARYPDNSKMGKNGNHTDIILCMEALESLNEGSIKPYSQKTASYILSKCLDIYDGSMIDEIAQIISNYAEEYNVKEIEDSDCSTCEYENSNKPDNTNPCNYCYSQVAVHRQYKRK